MSGSREEPPLPLSHTDPNPARRNDQSSSRRFAPCTLNRGELGVNFGQNAERSDEHCGQDYP